MSIKRTIVNIFPRSLILNIKYLYHTIDRLRRGKKKIECGKEIITISKKNTHVFFGYYDITPFNIKTDEIIYNNLVEKENKLHLIVSNLGNLKEFEIATTKAWNWQQGCRLRWMPNNNREIVFNDFDGKHYLARIINIDTKEERHIDAPLYDISPDGNYGLSIDFERLGNKRPGYGYTCRKYVESDHDLREDSIDLIDLSSNTRHRILTYEEILCIPGCNTGNISNNYINHLCFSPSGKQFLFFWLTADNSWHKAFLLVHNLETKKTILLEGKDKVSHYVWIDEDNIICTAANDDYKWHYYKYNVISGEKTVLNPEILFVDGHPSIFNQNSILTDTYPDLKGFQRLYISNMKEGGYNKLLEIYSNCCIEGEKRTDLHPRLNKDHSIISFDSNHNLYRTLNFLILN